MPSVIVLEPSHVGIPLTSTRCCLHGESRSFGGTVLGMVSGTVLRDGVVMNSCFGNGSTGEFTGCDVNAFKALY